jgi:hypothetical protein
LAAEGLSEAVEAHCEAEKSHRNIVVRQVKLGQAVAQSQSGSLLRSKVERNSTNF